MIKPSINNIIFFWEGPISNSRQKILLDCIYSTRIFNEKRPIYFISNNREIVFDKKFDIEHIPWNIDIIGKFFNQSMISLYSISHPRDLSDLLRLIFLYEYGGSYIDTDDLCINPISNTKNIICRSYDPHTCHYNNIEPKNCINGIYREIKGYEHIPIFPRNDCWHNFEPEHFIVREILSDSRVLKTDKPIYIGDNFSWQSLTMEYVIKYLSQIPDKINLGLTLLYLYEDFVAVSSYWDRCTEGGEMCDMYKKQFLDLKEYGWGFYKTTKELAMIYLDTVIRTYPYVSHLWLHSKDMKQDWMKNELSEKENISTWIYNDIKEKILNYKTG
jgi:hypothetical protein